MDPSPNPSLPKEKTDHPGQATDLDLNLGLGLKVEVEDEVGAETEARLQRSLTRKLDLRLLPFLSLLYLCSFLDRVNIGNAKVAGMAEDLGLTQAQYSWSLSIFFFGYILFEAPSNILLRLLSPGRWIPLIMLVWGTISTSMAAVHSAEGLLAARFFLGFAEAGLFPGVLYYLSMWYTRSEQAVRIAIFFAAANIAGAFGGILAFGISQMDGIGGLEGWRWIFLLEGIPTILLAGIAYFYLPNSPEDASFLSPEERAWGVERITREFGSNHTLAQGSLITWSQIRAALTDIKVPLHAILAFCGSVPMFSLSLFLPTIVQGLGFTSLSAQAMSSPPYVAGCLLLILWSWDSDRRRERGFHIAIPLSIATCGYISLCFVRVHAVQYVLTILTAAAVFSHVPAVLSWPSNNLSGPGKRASAVGLIQSLGNLGGVLGGQIYRDVDGPYFVRGHIICASLCAGGVFMSLLIKWYLHRENSRRELLLLTYPTTIREETKGDKDVHFRYIL